VELFPRDCSFVIHISRKSSSCYPSSDGIELAHNTSSILMLKNIGIFSQIRFVSWLLSFLTAGGVYVDK
jgi:hypothetical protein